MGREDRLLLARECGCEAARLQLVHDGSHLGAYLT